MKKFLFAALVALVPLQAGAQTGTPVKQSGNVTPGHPTQWVANGIVQDAGPALLGFLTGVGVVASGQGICQNSAQTGARNRLCFTTSSTGGGFTFDNLGGATGGLTFAINGTSYAFPYAVGGIVGPNPTVVGHLATWNNTIGTLLADTTIATALSGLCAASGAFPLYNATTVAWVCSTVGGTGSAATLSGVLTVTTNALALPAGASGTIFQLGAVDASNAFIYYDAFGVSGPHNATPHIVFRTARGTNASPSAVGTAIDNTPTLLGSTGDYFGALFGLGYQNGGAYEVIAPTALAFRPAELQTPSAQGSRVQIAVTPNGTTAGYYAFTFDQSGTFLVNNTVTVAPPAPALGAALTPVQLVGAIGNQGIEMDSASASGSNFIFGIRADGPPNTRTAVGAASGVLQFGALAFDGTSNNTAASLDFFTLNLQSLTDHSGFFRFRTVPSGSTVIAEAMRIQASGGISVGTTTDPGIGAILANTSIKATTYMQSGVTVVGSLPTCNAGTQGARMFVTDQATAIAYHGAVTGSGAFKQSVLCDGTAWYQD